MFIHTYKSKDIQLTHTHTDLQVYEISIPQRIFSSLWAVCIKAYYKYPETNLTE